MKKPEPRISIKTCLLCPRLLNINEPHKIVGLAKDKSPMIVHLACWIKYAYEKQQEREKVQHELIDKRLI